MKEINIPFSENPCIKSPDSSTLFTTSGMQQFKPLFQNPNYIGTLSNVQSCLRLNDLHEVGDGTHRLHFEMIGFYSFRQYSLKQTVDLMMEFLKRINLNPDYVTIHPDKISEWESLYEQYSLEIRPDSECIWSDGQIGGYCTEFYINNIEIGNIVNPLGNCIDVGFGLERLLLVSNSLNPQSRLELLEDTCQKLIDSKVEMGDYKEGYILKKLVTLCVQEGSLNPHEYFEKVRKFQVINYLNYKRNKIKPRHKNKDSSYWLNTFGIDEGKLDYYEEILNRYNK